MVTKKTIDQLPSLPQILVQILDTIHSDNADYQHIAQIIRHDTAVAARLISIANSSYFSRGKKCKSIEKALLFLGTDTVKTIVITTSIKQYFNHFNQQHNSFLNQFWRKSLTTANFAQVLATLTGYSAPDEAYLCGLLSDVGQLILLTDNDKCYLSVTKPISSDLDLLLAEQQEFSINHCQLGGELIDSWAVEGFMSDAIRYHHEPADQVQDAHHLVKIINLANLLSGDTTINDVALESADKLFGFNEALTHELRSRISTDVDNLARSLGINIDDDKKNALHQAAHHQLGLRLGELAEMSQVNSGLWRSQGKEDKQRAIRRALLLTFGIKDCELFLISTDDNQLHSQWLIEPTNNEPLFKIPTEKKRSIVSDALLKATTQSCDLQTNNLTVIDRQLLRHCKAETLVCWPLHGQNKKNVTGVLVIGANNEQQKKLTRNSNMATTLCDEIATIVLSAIQTEHISTNTEPYQNKINEAVHEAGNPLSIIRNYLETLRLKLGEEHSANEGIELIKEEIDRVGNILLRLKDPDLPEEARGVLMINSIIDSTTKIFRQSVCATKQITLKLNLDNNMPEIPGNPAHLKQVLTNLLKNSVEAISQNGEIVVSSESDIIVNGRNFAAITVQDNGPGMSMQIKQQLFNPITSTKPNHAGLGLSIVKKLIDDMNGSVVCRSNKSHGTQFQILLPQ